MTRYAYMTVRMSQDQDLNDMVLTQYGQLGWRLVHTGWTYFRLERTYYGDE